MHVNWNALADAQAAQMLMNGARWDVTEFEADRLASNEFQVILVRRGKWQQRYDLRGVLLLPITISSMSTLIPHP